MAFCTLASVFKPLMAAPKSGGSGQKRTPAMLACRSATWAANKDCAALIFSARMPSLRCLTSFFQRQALLACFFLDCVNGAE